MPSSGSLVDQRNTSHARSVPRPACCPSRGLLQNFTLVQKRVGYGTHHKLNLMIGTSMRAFVGLYNEDKNNQGRKVKCTLVQALRLCTGHTAHRGSRGIALPFHDHGTRRGWGISVTPRPFFTLGNDAVPIAQEAGRDPGTVWTGAENLTPTGIRSPDRPARSQSLYRLSYRAHKQGLSNIKLMCMHAWRWPYRSKHVAAVFGSRIHINTDSSKHKATNSIRIKNKLVWNSHIKIGGGTPCSLGEE